MKNVKLQILTAIFASLFSMSLFAQLSPEQAADLATAAEQGDVALQAAITTLLAENPNVQVSDVATTLAQQGQFTAQVTATLVNAGVSPSDATVAVRTAIPSATSTQLSQGLANAGVATTTAAIAVAAANATARPTPLPAVANVNAAGALVDSSGQVVTFNSQRDLLKAALAFLQTQSDQRPQFGVSNATPQLRSILNLANQGALLLGFSIDPDVVLGTYLLPTAETREILTDIIDRLDDPDASINDIAKAINDAAASLS